MYRKILAITICVLMLGLVGCKKTDEKPQSSAPANSEPQVVTYVNNLTGEDSITDEEIYARRPVAIMVNNAWEGTEGDAQKVQTGLTKADIVYETEVEGGITRLLAVYKDISKVEKVGTVRSARYAYIDLAMGHSAIYIHHGMDYTYAKPHLKDTQTFSLGTSNGGVRIRNEGVAQEHTLYGMGDKIWESLEKKYDTELNDVENWQKFAEGEVSYAENIANTVTVKFSSKYISSFKYDSASGKYVRYFRDIERKDYYTKESEYFKNVFVLKTDIRDYADGKHRYVDLSSGSGYYCVNGTYTPIKWAKGSSSNGFKFTLEDGTPLEVNKGNSWVCLHGSEFAPAFE